MYILPKVSSPAANQAPDPYVSRTGESPPRRMLIAIDGPAASGKTTVGRLLAARLGFRFLDTGFGYRSLALLALRQGVSLSDGPGLEELARSPALQAAMNEAALTAEGLASQEQDREPRELYTPEVGDAASQVAQRPAVREALVGQQRALASRGGIVMVGRDVGTVVLPHADLKVFLQASSETRARRRLLQRTAGGEERAFAQVLADIEERDQRDIHRSHSPLLPAEDARLLDTEQLDTRQTVEKILGWLGGC